MRLEIRSGPSVKTVSFSSPTLLSTLLAINGATCPMPCGGRGLCLKCRVNVQGAISEPSERERLLLGEAALAEGVRYACMTTVQGDVTVTLAPESKASIVTDGVLPALPDDPPRSGYGVAVDIGTTTLAAYLYDLSDRRLLSTASAINPQASFGADVISRIEKSLGDQRRALAQAIRRALTSLIEEMCATPEKIIDIVCVGNTAMLYLLCERDPSSLASAPFAADCLFGMEISAAALELPFPNARVYLARCAGAYVGADITAAILACELTDRSLPTLLTDIGTNGEMALWDGHKLWCCSTAAGPAFEGAGISMGMPAAEGAVNDVFLENNRMICQTIGNQPAKGICGSGLIRLIAALLDAGVVDETGMLLSEGHAFTEQVQNDAFILPQTTVSLTAHDIRAIQLAKAAIAGGIQALLHHAAQSTVDTLIIAGGFGSFLDPNSAERIGLLPKGYAAKTQSFGNAAGIGACALLLSPSLRSRADRIAEQAHIVELSSDPFFMEQYVESMLFETP